MARAVLRESGREGGQDGVSEAPRSRQETADRRALRYRYLAVKNLIRDEREDITSADSEEFDSIITQVESLHEQVEKPREQVADAEALLGIANRLVASVRSQTNDGVSASDFVTGLVRNFSEQTVAANNEDAATMFNWVDVGQAVSHVFRTSPGCCTMVGPMNNTGLKERKVVVQRKRTRPSESTHPEELFDAGADLNSDTDKNMLAIFGILRRKRNVRLENLVLNRASFAQTVENIFALSFLVKDGRAEITVDDSGHHIVSPRNSPKDSAVASGKVSHSHFIFRFDYKDWKLMKNSVAAGEELMPHRSSTHLDVSVNNNGRWPKSEDLTGD